jgi:8-oxo-dGTP diphosphatase
MASRPARPRPARRGHRAPEGYDPRAYPSFAVTVDIVILTLVGDELCVLLVKRRDDPFVGHWALPGGFKRPDETLDEAAVRELREETGVAAPAHLAQFRAYGDPGRDPRTNVVTVAYLAVMRNLGGLLAGGDAADARLWPVTTALHGDLPLAFDHERILRDAVEQARHDLAHTSLATAFVGPTFTLSQLRTVYESVWDTELDPANFRRSLTASDDTYVEPTGERAAPGPEGGRPPELYRATDAWAAGSPVKPPKPRAKSRPAAGPARRRPPRAGRD